MRTMIKEIIFILFIIVVILIAIAGKPKSVLREHGEMKTNSAGQVYENVVSTDAAPTKHKSNRRVRFSPEKKERTYSIKTGKIIGEDITVAIDDENSN